VLLLPKYIKPKERKQTEKKEWGRDQNLLN